MPEEFAGCRWVASNFCVRVTKEPNLQPDIQT
jgi:hypothetical protein